MLVHRWITLGGQPLLDPGSLRAQNIEFDSPLDFWSKANSFDCPRGMEPGMGYALMLRSNLNKLNLKTQQDLTFYEAAEGQSNSTAFTLKKLLIVDARCMNRAYAGDTNAAYLLKLADKRWLLKNSYVNKAYNIRMPAPPTTTTGMTDVKLFYSDSLNAGALWTWATLVSNLWGLLPAAQAGSVPSLPFTPNATPEGFRFFGVSAWDAIGAVLKKIGCAIVLNPKTDAFTIIKLGSTQASLSSQLASYVNSTNYEYDPVTVTAAMIPETIKVLFNKIPQHYGSHDDSKRSSNWIADPVYVESIASGVSGAVTGTVQILWDDLPAVTTPAGTVQNTTQTNARAVEIAANWVAARQLAATPKNRRFFGSLAFSTGSEVSRVCWRDYGDSDGTLTEVTLDNGMEPSGAGGLIPGVNELLAGPDFQRATTPNYPQATQWVLLYESGLSQVPANSDGFYPGKIQRTYPSGSAIAYSDQDNCWIKFADGYTQKILNSTRMLGRFAGSVTTNTSAPAAEDRPLLVVERQYEVIKGVAQADIAKGANGNVYRYDASGSLISENITCYSPLGSVSNTKIVYYVWVGNRFEIIATEC